MRQNLKSKNLALISAGCISASRREEGETLLLGVGAEEDVSAVLV